MTAEIIYEGGLRTTATHLKSGTIITTDAPPDNHGRGESFSPTDLTAVSLACCMLTVTGIKAAASNFSIEGAKATVKKIMETDPRRISEIHVHIKFPAFRFSEKEKQLIFETSVNCPVAKSLHPNIKQYLTCEFEDGLWKEGK